MGSEVEVTKIKVYHKDKAEKKYFRWGAFMIDCISACKSHMVFMGLDLEADK